MPFLTEGFSKSPGTLCMHRADALSMTPTSGAIFLIPPACSRQTVMKLLMMARGTEIHLDLPSSYDPPELLL